MPKRLDSLIDDYPKTYKQRLEKPKSYIKNNTAKIVNYRESQKKDWFLVVTSQNQPLKA